MDKQTCTQLVVQTLQLSGKAPAREIATRSGIDNSSSIFALLALETQGKVQQLNGYWWLSESAVEELAQEEGKPS
ncbi:MULTISPECIES: hypothetical protein [Lelliottia]|uniref:Uncharacterized protein n=1 Tax=Lelliottia aquatilis TaxID=2080838 RepID=A0ABX5A2S0_9ENTR|nr:MULTISPECIES: hypothetical protein [Lelliottia]POZ14083.1 hypothetical protein C3Z09_20110 [Lelliottia aquatilis]POZ23985.1 hypothetical protein C3712_07115 [Lelliottia aquatilis]POZ27613.1 hypothetical protein C3708_08540 [Lelliottia sp. 7254-16]POZ29882.1 hypothetical protein C3711_01750 [Lelliottia aquatilis]POZ35447.1 hypothetical protein C3710_01750 [Lelliottia aquatilis]